MLTQRLGVQVFDARNVFAVRALRLLPVGWEWLDVRTGRSEQYRRFAARCLEIARSVQTPQTKAVMLKMAQVWSRLAEDTHLSPDQESAGDVED